jgi:tRNA-2-methylthio-N6-dimethylallyladenosine synthase
MMARIRETVPGASVSSDFIVGFCGETEASFERSLWLLERSRFKNSFIFKYSTRPGTKADTLYADDIPDDVKKRRNNDLLVAQTAISQQLNREFIGQEIDVLVEGPSERAVKGLAERGPVPLLTGRTRCDRIAVFPGADRLIGRFVTVRVLDASPVTLFAEPVTHEGLRGGTAPGRSRLPSLPVISV